MSVKRKKAGIIFSWQKSFSILPPWRKGKADKDAVLNNDIILTKVKLFSNIHERLLTADDSASKSSTVSVFEQMNSNLDDKRQPRVQCDLDYQTAIFSDSQLLLDKFGSEDSGVELPSGANSPSNLTGSEQSFMVHSRESSCNSCNLNSDSTTLPIKLGRYAQSNEKKAEDLMDDSLSTAVDSQDDLVKHSDELIPAVQLFNVGVELDGDQCRASGIGADEYDEYCGKLKKNNAATGKMCLESGRHGTCDDMMGSGFKPEPVRRSATSDSLEEYMDQCCRLSEGQHASSRGSGLGYLEHICQLIEKIGQLQETNLQLQRQICSLQDARTTMTKVQHCSCGIASLDFRDSGTLSDLSTVHKVTRYPLMSTRRDLSSEGLTPIPLWKRGLNRRSYAEEEVRVLWGSKERLSIPHHRLSETHTWGRVKDLVRTTKLRKKSRLALTSTSLKMSCPQLYMPDLELAKPDGKKRSTMMALGHQSKLDFPWLQ